MQSKEKLFDRSASVHQPEQLLCTLLFLGRCLLLDILQYLFSLIRVVLYNNNNT